MNNAKTSLRGTVMKAYFTVVSRTETVLRLVKISTYFMRPYWLMPLKKFRSVKLYTRELANG